MAGSVIARHSGLRVGGTGVGNRGGVRTSEEEPRGFVSAEDVDKRLALSAGHVATLAIPKRRLVPATVVVYIKLRG